MLTFPVKLFHKEHKVHQLKKQRPPLFLLVLIKSNKLKFCTNKEKSLQKAQLKYYKWNNNNKKEQHTILVFTRKETLLLTAVARESSRHVLSSPFCKSFL